MASKFGIKLSVSVADLITSIQKAIEKINKSNALKDSPINVRANKDVLIDSIKKAIKSANSALSKSDDAKVKLGVNQDALINSITSGVRAFNRQTGTEGKTVKLTADLDITAALKKLQAQLAKNNLTGVSVGTDNTAKTAYTEKQKKVNTDNLISSIKQKTETEREYVQLTLDSYSQAIESEKQRELAAKNTTAALKAQNKMLETGNDLLRQRTNYADAAQQNPTTRSRTYGSSYENTTYYDTFNEEKQNWETIGSTIVENKERLNKANAKADTMLAQLKVDLEKTVAKYTGEIGNKGIDKSTKMYENLETERKHIEDIFNQIQVASGDTKNKLIADADEAIEKLKVSVAKAQDASWKGSSLRIKDIPTHKDIYANELNTLMTKLASSHIPAEILINDFKALREQLDKVNDSASLTGFQNNLDIFKTKAQTLSVIFKELDGSLGKLNSASGVVNSSGFNGTFGTETVGSLNTQITELTDKLNTLKTAMTNAKSPETVQENINSYNQLEKEITDIVNAVTQLQSLSTGANGITNKLSSILNSAIFKQNGSNERVVTLKNQVTELDAECRKFLADLGKDVTPEGLNKSAQVLDTLQAKFADLRTQVNGVKNELQQTNINGSFLKQQQELIARIQSYIRDNPKAMGKINPNSGLTYGEEFDKLNKSAQAAANSGAIKQISYQTAALQAQIKAAGQEGATFFSELTSKAAKFIKWTGMTLAITKARMYIRQLFTTVYELDTALVDLRKTFEGNDEELNQFYTDSNKFAKQLGVTTKEIIEQGSAWARLGYSSKDAMETMAKMSSMFAAISPDMNTEEATNGLVSIMKAFKIDPDKVLDDVLSKVNIIGNTAATSNGAIVEMLKRSSAAMAEANTTLEETIALETAAYEILQDDAKVGNAFKSISMKLRGYDEETGEYIGDVQELYGKIADWTKTASTPGGISLFTDESKTTYKSIYQILKEISEIWDDLTDKEHAKLQENVAGKYQGNVFAATMSNFEAAEKAMDDMANSAGNAEAEMDVIRDSAEYALNEMKETFTELSQNAVSRGELKALIKTGTALLDIVNNIVKGIGAVPALLGTIFGIIGTKSKTLLSFNKYTGKFNLFGTELGKGWFSNFKANRAELKATANLVNELRTSFNGVTISEDMMNKVMASSSAELKGLVNDFKNGTIKSDEFVTRLDGMSAKLKTVNVNANTLKTGLKSLGAAIANIAVSMAAVWAVSTAISAVVKAVDNANHAVENLTKSAKENDDTVKSSKTELERLNDELGITQKRLTELERIKLTRGLNLFEEDEYNNLKKYNDQLERQIKLEKAKMELALQEANNESKKAVKQAERDWGVIVAGNKIQQRWGTKASDLPFSFGESDNFRIEQEAQLVTYESMLKKYKQLQDEQSKLSGKEYEKNGKEIDKFKKRLDSLESTLMNGMSTIYQWEASLNPDDPVNKETLEYLEKLTHKYETLMGTAEDTFSEVWTQGKYATVREELQKLAKSGDLTAEKFNELNDTDIDGIEAFRKELEEIGVTDAKEIVRSIYDELDEGAKDATTSTEGLSQALEELYGIIDELIDKQEKLADTLKKIQLGTKLTAQEIYELINEMPELAKYVEKTADGYTISEEGIRTVSGQNENDTRTKVTEDLEAVRAQIKALEKKEELEKKVEDLRKEMEERPREELQRELFDTETLYGEAVKECQGITKSVEDLRTEEEKLVVVQGLVNDLFDNFVVLENYDDAKSKISDFNSQLQTLNETVEKLNEGNLLSDTEMADLVDIVPELFGYFDELSEGYTISADKIAEASDKVLKARNEFIQDLIKQAEDEITAIEQSKLVPSTIINNYNRFAATIVDKELADQAAREAQEAQVEIDIANERIKDIEELIKKYQALMSNIKNPENDLSDKLQNQIDHYKSIIDAVSAVRDRYAEVLDNEIDALNDSKDALKDANDERQRELDLIEARNDLENAKKRKVYVYSEGEGFKQVQDQKAVKEAEEKYRDAITGIQEAEIDKAIKERENKKEAIDDKIKDLINAEENIQNAMIISQAMKEYGLTDAKDLLTLSDDVKQGIIEGLAENTLQKDIEDNKENTEYTAVTLKSLLKELGSTKNIDDIDPSVFNNMGKISKDNAVKGFTDKLKNDAQARIDNVTYNNAPIINANFTINNADDPQAVADTVHQELGNFLRQYCDSIK